MIMIRVIVVYVQRTKCHAMSYDKLTLQGNLAFSLGTYDKTYQNHKTLLHAKLWFLSDPYFEYGIYKQKLNFNHRASLHK